MAGLKTQKCIFCGCIMLECISEEEAIEEFNKRATEAEIRAKAIDEFAEKAIQIVYEANNRRRNPQPRDMVADIHYKLRDLAEQIGRNRNDGSGSNFMA